MRMQISYRRVRLDSVLDSLRRGVALTAILLFAGCAFTTQNIPRNPPIATSSSAPEVRAPKDLVEEVVVALSFSGGGLRASAYSYGVIEGLANTPGRQGRMLLDDVTFITSVSGGSITAAYYGLNGRDTLSTFRDRVLRRDGEAQLRFSLLNPVNIARLISGGLNDRENLREWLEQHVFQGATFADIYRRRKPEVWINATNVYHRIAFPFHERVFEMLCSDLSQLPVAEAVYASMAVPIFFAPAILEKHPERCVVPIPERIANGHSRVDMPLALRAVSRAVIDFRSLDKGRYVKLIDGGVTDNFGLAAIFQSRLALGTPYGPLTERDAVKLKKMLFIVVDAGQSPQTNWNQTLDGPSGIELASAAIDTALDANARTSYDAFVPMMRAWQDDIVRYRCGLTREAAEALGAGANWNCRDVAIEVTRFAFDMLEPTRAAKLAAIPTRLKLPDAEVDSLIAAGRDSVRESVVIKRFQQDVAAIPATP
jgi:NTE family protein